MNTLEDLKKFDDYIDNINMSSFDNIDKLKENNQLEDIMSMFVSRKTAALELTWYLDTLLNSQYPYYNKKMILDKYLENNLTWVGLYALAQYADVKEGYRYLPFLLKGLIEKLNIEKYKYLSLEDLIAAVYATHDIKYCLDTSYDQTKCEILHKVEYDKDKYPKYDAGYLYNSVDVYNNNGEEFSVWAEHRAYDDEIRLLNNNTNCKEPYNYVKWVAREYGDGYGFDVLSLDTITFKEKLIEVKSGKTESITLTPNEVKVMRNCNFKKADYYVQKYTYNPNNQLIYPSTFRYIPEYDKLLCMDNQKDYYGLASIDMPDYNRGTKKCYSLIKC